ncbi:hypothetical protein HAX54_028766 [Datura stramonium]|uniref:Formin-like protein n=1 Tax=Datura stramonium TaxID=4076 RepID=A0ABS8S9W5_DATST|nr:hypothetical protein [Datura stramonium]
MVAGKVKVAMGLQKSPANPKPSKQDSSPKPPSPSPSCPKQQPPKSAGFSRSFGVYFPRSSAQVQPRPPDVAELLRIVEELRERESRLKTELLEKKLLKESVAILPLLESEITLKDAEIERKSRMIECLEVENERLREEVEVLHIELSKQNGRYDERIKAMEAEISELKKANEELSAHRLVDVTNGAHKQTNLTKYLRKCATQPSITVTSKTECEVKEEIVSALEMCERPRHSRSNSDELAEISVGIMSLRSRVPRVPKPPPRPSSALLPSSSSSSSLSSSSSSPSNSSLSDSAERALAEISNIPPPPPPPPPPAAAPKMVTRALQGSLWDELQRNGETQLSPEFDFSELETLFSATVPKSDNAGKSGGRRKSVGSKPDRVHLVDLRRANNTEIMLTKVKMPLPDMMAAALAMDESILDADQVENLIKFCPTKDEMELLKNYTGDKELLGKCEQFFLELMKVPRVESKLRVFLFKIQFNSQITDFKKSLNTVNSACEEVRHSLKLKEILKKILYLGNTLNQGTARGSAIGFKLDSLLKLTDTRATNNKMTLMHYLCKVLAAKSPSLLDFHVDLVSLETASKIQLKSLAEEMQAIIKGLEKVKKELEASETDGPVSEIFRKTLKEFVGVAEAQVGSVKDLYSVAGRNADALALYFGEDPARCPFEQVTATLLNFVRLFRKAHEENLKQAELERKKVQKEAEMENAKGINLTKKGLK